MDDVTKTKIEDQIKVKKSEAEAFSASAQEELNKRNREIQKQTADLQNLARSFQTEIDKRAGAIESLQAIITPTDTDPKIIELPNQTKPRKK
jgi:uncharacterized protein YdaT